jgi:hypothetical protein
MKDPAIFISIVFNEVIPYYSVTVSERYNPINMSSGCYLGSELSRYIVKNRTICYKLFGLDASIEEKKINLMMLGASKRKIKGLMLRFKHYLESIASELGVTRERVRQIQVEALTQLRRIIRRGGIARDTLL